MKKLLGKGDQVSFKLYNGSAFSVATATATRFKAEYIEALHEGKVIQILRADVIL